MKKVISVIMLLCMILAMIPVSVVAETATTITPQTPPADSVAITDLKGLAAMITTGGSFHLANDIHITFDMITATYGENAVTTTKNEDGSVTKSYVFETAISETATAADAKEVTLYGCGKSITAEAGITFSGRGVLFNKVYGDTSVYDLTIGSADNYLDYKALNKNTANIGIITSGHNAVTDNFVAKNITIYANMDDTNRSNQNHMAAIVGKSTGRGLIENCTFYGTMTNNLENVKLKRHYGAMIGTMTSGNMEIVNCTNYGNFSGPSTMTNTSNITAMGGMVGAATFSGDGSLKITGCVNYGKMESNQIAGGIVGYLTCRVTLEDCLNYGEVKQMMEAAENGSHYAAGGIVGYTANVVKMKNCINHTDAISAVASTAGVGGLIGYSEPGNILDINDSYSLTNADLQMATGAAVRYTEPTTLRFRTVLGVGLDYETLCDVFGAENIKMGTLVAKADDVAAAGSFDALSSDKVTDVPQTGWYDEDQSSFTATTAEIAETDHNVKYVAIGYLSVKVNGEWKTLYAKYDADNARSVAEVAQKAVEDRSDLKDTYEGYNTLIEADNNYSPYTVEILDALKAMYTPAN